MQWYQLNDRQFNQYRQPFIRFLRRYGDKRITRTGIQWLAKLDSSSLNKEGTLVGCTLDQKKLVGIIAVADYGIEESLMAVHTQYRNKHIARDMAEHAINFLGKIYGRVAMDNPASLKVCFENGMVAFKLIKGPTNKPTLWLGGGNWKKEDVADI